MTGTTIKLKGMETFHDQNPGFDILKFDFHDKKAVDKLKLENTEQLEELKAYQRILRLHDDQDTADKLINRGLVSAHHIARMPEDIFVKQHGKALGLSEDELRQLHRRSVQTKIRAWMFAVSLKGTVGSPFYRDSRMGNLDTSAIDYVKSLPSYQDFFGSLDYCSCPHDQSILSPAAYLTDLLRIIYENIDNPAINPDIPGSWHFSERRPDIGCIPLTEEMTISKVPFLQIVNSVLEKFIMMQTSWTDVFREFTKIPYPFNQPFNLPLTQTRIYLEKLGVPLVNLYTTFKATATSQIEANLPTTMTIAREALGLSPEQEIAITTKLTTGTDIGKQYGVSDGRILSLTATGTVSIAKDGTTVNGTNTKFQSEVRPGDQVQVEHQRRIVKEINSETELIVTEKWIQSVTSKAMTVYPKNNLEFSVNFNRRTELEFTQLKALLVQHLDTNEIAANIANNFYINKGMATGTYLQIIIDRSDPNWPVSLIQNMDLPALDRLNRLIRLSRISGMDFADLDWAIKNLGGNEITSECIQTLGQVKSLSGKLAISFDETIALFGTLKTIGVGDARHPLDLFDRVYNNPVVLGSPAGVAPAFTAKGAVSINADNKQIVTGTNTNFQSQIKPGMRIRIIGEMRKIESVSPDQQQLTVTNAFTQAVENTTMVVYPSDDLSADALPVYHPEYADNPTYTDPVIDWIVDPIGDNNPTIRIRLRSALEIGDDDLTMVGKKALASLGITNGKLPLTVENLSLVYSYTKMAKSSGLSVKNYLKFMELMGKTRLRSIDEAVEVASQALWLKDTKLDPYALDFALNNNQTKNYNTGFNISDVSDFLRSLWVSAQEWLVTKNTFINQDITEERSSSYFKKLKATEFLSQYGVVLNKTIDFSAVAFIDPLNKDSFITPMISATQSDSAYNELVAHSVLNDKGILSASFDSQTDLSYLFPDVTDQKVRDAMISQVRAILLDTQTRIAEVVQTLLTYGGMPGIDEPSRGLQCYNLSNLLAIFFYSNTDMIMTLSLNIATITGMADYIDAFVQPPQEGSGWPPSDIIDFMTWMSRELTLVDQLKLTAIDVEEITQNPEPYGIESISKFTLESVRSIWFYKWLTRVFNDTDGSLALYFSQESTDDKFLTLSTLTGWDINQVRQLVRVLFGSSKEYDTITGVVRTKECFDLCSSLALDINTSLELASLNALPTAVDDSIWKKYVAAAATIMGSLKTKFGGADWDKNYRPILHKINETKRNELAAYAIIKLNALFPELKTYNDLYDYLLIDIEMSGCADISYIKQAILSAQLYMKRAHMMLEPGITNLQIPGTWWSWLSDYRLWEANRKIFLYPENYLEPELRNDGTPLFDKAKDSLTSNNITPQTVNDTYVEYFEQFSALSGLKQVGAFYGPAPDPDVPGSIVDTLFIVARTATEPYTYYIQRKINNLIWTAWEKVDQTISSPIATPVYAFNRLFLFWVEQSNTSISLVSGGNANNSVDTHAILKYSFINYSGGWSSPQLLDNFIINFNPMQGDYKTDQIQPNSIDTSDIEWRTVSPLLITGDDAANQRILVNYGHFYRLPGGTPVDPSSPLNDKIPNPDAFELATRIYDSSLFSVNASREGLSGATFVSQGCFLDPNLNSSSTNVIAMNYDCIPDAPKPYTPLIPHIVLDPGKIPTMRIIDYDNVFLINYVAQGARDDSIIAPTIIELMYHISDRAGYTSPVVNMPFWYIFGNGDETFLIRSTQTGLKTMAELLTVNNSLSNQTNETDLTGRPYTTNPETLSEITWSVERLSTGAITRLNQALFAGGVTQLLDVTTQVDPATPLYPFNRFYKDPGGSAPPNNLQPPSYPNGDSIDINGPYGSYFREIYLFLPWLVANQLRNNQRYEDSKTWLEYIFNPTIPEGSDPTVGSNQQDRFWRLIALRNFNVESMLEILGDPAQISAYNNHPFDPQAIAKLRNDSYQKAIVMRYVDLLLEWGDFEFTIDTWESITRATLLYILAQELLGSKPVNIGPCSIREPLTFNDIRTEYGDNIPQFLIGLENAISALTTNIPDSIADRYVPFNDLDMYFCVPENEELVSKWDKVADRLYKIRYCMNIRGVVRKLSLFEPPISPYALVQAVSRGAVSEVVQQLFSTAPAYRFNAIIAQAKNFTSELTQVGNLLLSALEKKDAEELSRLRSVQEQKILNLTTQVRQLQIQEIEENLKGLNISLQATTSRRDYYQDLISNGLLASEQLHIAMLVLTGVLSTTGSIMRGLGSIAYLVPNAGSPFAMTYGGREIGASLTAAASVFDALANISNSVGSCSLTMAGYERREQEWQQQLNQANFDIDQVTCQIESMKLQLENTRQQLTINQVEIDNAVSIENFLKSKFTNQELYEWMVGRISAVFREAYRLALEVAMSAQQAYQFELNSNEQFINFEYWNSTYNGLLSGDQLMLNLSQMERSYYQKNTRKLEIVKTISLLALDPKALLDLKSKGKCQFRFDELLFDDDYPGHYARQVKSVSITIPAVIGPYQDFKATLTQLGSQILIKPDIDGVAYLLGQGHKTPDTSVLRSNWRANQKVAISRGIDDDGLFALNFNDERYLPFEGTGAVSSWILEIPKFSNRINYDSISDIIINLKYTASDGGESFAAFVRNMVTAIPYKGTRAFNLGTEFSNAWYAFMHPAKDAVKQNFDIMIERSYFPANLSLDTLTSIYVRLALATGKSLDGTLTATLTIGEAPGKITKTLTFNNTIIVELKDLSIDNWVNQPWSITVEKSDLPQGIRDAETGFIDPDALLSMALLISYDANRPGSV
jgi:hypothetical protein